jgi:F-type H+-transporting ATPase subunit epsilon
VSTHATDRKRLGIRLLTPEGTVFSGQAAMIVAPSIAGEVGILPRHQPIVAFLRPGECRLKMLDDSEEVFATTDGYMAVEEDQVLILVEQAERASEIDAQRAQDGQPGQLGGRAAGSGQAAEAHVAAQGVS